MQSLVLLVGIGMSTQVRTLLQLLTAPAERAKTFHRGSRVYDERELGYTDEGAYVLDTSASGNSNSGHD